MTIDADADADATKGDISKAKSTSDDGDLSKFDSKSAEIIRELREENKNRRLQAKSYKSELDLLKIESDNKSKSFETEKLELTGKLQKLTTYEKKLVNAEIKAEAVIAGIRDSDLIKLIDSSDISISEDGVIDIELIKTKISELKENKPFLFGEDKKTSTSSGSKVTKTEDDKKTDALSMSSDEWRQEKKRFMSSKAR